MRLFLFCFSLLAFFSCDNKETPADILPPEKMENVLWDIMQADEVVNHLGLRDPGYSRLDSSVKYYQLIFKNHGTDSAHFKKSFHYYKKHPEKFKLLLDSLEKHASHRIITESQVIN